MTEQKNCEFALFIDESGSPKPNPKDPAPYFALGGVLVKRVDEAIIEQAVADFKQRWNISLDIPLHGNEIRSKKRRFAWLGKLPEQERNDFMEDLTTTITSLPIIVHACVVSRQGYHNRYLDKYGDNTWEMMKSAFSILVERSVKFVSDKDESIMIYYEEAGKREDRLLQQYFNEIRESGHPFDSNNASKYSPLSAEQISKCLRGIEGKKKNNPILQIADLCLYPVARGKNKPDDRAYLALKENQILIDSQLRSKDIKSRGIKYYCFDNTP
ncbi:MAG: DUF3800 domain-containing protein [Xenococcaceae cyanobacterium MO_234.B1]|nr:DUF3800 domain-containing protein [Xenococcaceae cyanobacterium MO_234.B1]